MGLTSSRALTGLASSSALAGAVSSASLAGFMSSTTVEGLKSSTTVEGLKSSRIEPGLLTGLNPLPGVGLTRSSRMVGEGVLTGARKDRAGFWLRPVSGTNLVLGPRTSRASSTTVLALVDRSCTVVLNLAERVGLAGAMPRAGLAAAAVASSVRLNGLNLVARSSVAPAGFIFLASARASSSLLAVDSAWLTLLTFPVRPTEPLPASAPGRINEPTKAVVSPIA